MRTVSHIPHLSIIEPLQELNTCHTRTWSVEFNRFIYLRVDSESVQIRRALRDYALGEESEKVGGNVRLIIVMISLWSDINWDGGVIITDDLLSMIQDSFFYSVGESLAAVKNRITHDLHIPVYHSVPMSWEWRKRTSIPVEARQQVFAADNHRCVICGATKQLSVDHIRSVRRGGTSDRDNLQTLCRSCNSRKGAL